MALKRDKYEIEVQNDDEIKLNHIFFDFIQQKFNRLDGLYLYEKSLLIVAIIKKKSRNQSSAEIEILNREKNKNKNKEVTSKTYPKNLVQTVDIR